LPAAAAAGTANGQEWLHGSNPAPGESVETFPDFVGFGLGHHTAQYFTPWLFALFKWSLAKASNSITEIEILKKIKLSLL